MDVAALRKERLISKSNLRSLKSHQFKNFVQNIRRMGKPLSAQLKRKGRVVKHTPQKPSIVISVTTLSTHPSCIHATFCQ